MCALGRWCPREMGSVAQGSRKGGLPVFPTGYGPPLIHIHVQQRLPATSVSPAPSAGRKNRYPPNPRIHAPGAISPGHPIAQVTWSPTRDPSYL